MSILDSLFTYIIIYWFTLTVTYLLWTFNPSGSALVGGVEPQVSLAKCGVRLGSP